MLPRLLPVFLILSLLLVGPAQAQQPTSAANGGHHPALVIVHGAWGGAWQFMKLDPLLRARGWDVRRITLTGLGERAHLASPEIGLETHIQDVVNLILYEDLHDVVLLGHSYGGMVITGVADRIPHRISRLIYLDAFLPKDGESVMALFRLSPEITKHLKDGFIEPWWQKEGKLPPRDVPHPYKTFTDPIVLKNPAAWYIPGTYILTVDPGKKPEDDDFYAMSKRAEAKGWPVVIMEADHNPQWRKPEETAEVIGPAR